MKELDGKVAAITGAASGIGRALATALAARGCGVALADIDDAGLAETANRARANGDVTVTTRRVDVADRTAIRHWADEVVRDHGTVNIVFNNAGVALDGTVSTMSDVDFEWLMDINFWGVVHGTRAFLPHLRAAGDGHVVNISSVFGLLGVPSQSAYCAAKFGVRGFTDSLRSELDLERCGVSATSIHPGGIDTNIVRNARLRGADGGDVSAADREDAARTFARAARTSPDRAADAILRAVEKDKRRAMIGGDAHVFDLVSRVSPNLAQRIMTRLARRGSTAL